MEIKVKRLEIVNGEEVWGLYFDMNSDQGDIAYPNFEVRGEGTGEGLILNYADLKRFIAAVEKYRPDLVTKETTD